MTDLCEHAMEKKKTKNELNLKVETLYVYGYTHIWLYS